MRETLLIRNWQCLFRLAWMLRCGSDLNEEECIAPGQVCQIHPQVKRLNALSPAAYNLLTIPGEISKIRYGLLSTEEALTIFPFVNTPG
jgi:hypothetical protein